MAKVGTAHIEIKPVVNEEALAGIVERIESAIECAISKATTGRPLFDNTNGAIPFQNFNVRQPDGTWATWSGTHLEYDGNDMYVADENLRVVK